MPDYTTCTQRVSHTVSELGKAVCVIWRGWLDFKDKISTILICDGSPVADVIIDSRYHGLVIIVNNRSFRNDHGNM